jgi:hypothetical protein
MVAAHLLSGAVLSAVIRELRYARQPPSPNGCLRDWR